MAIYKAVWSDQSTPPESSVVANAAFSGSNSLEKATTRPGEVRKWVSVSASVQLSKNAEGQLEAGGGGSESGVYERPGPTAGSRPTVNVRKWAFRIDKADGPPDRGTLGLEATVTASGQDQCPAQGAKIEIIIRDGGTNHRLDHVILRGGCVNDFFTSDRGIISRADVTLKTVGG
jgi:hypothetical protein